MIDSDSTSILDLVNNTLELPTLPEVVTRLREVMADPEVGAYEVAAVIATDPAVSANLLRLVNSAYYGFQVQVSTVNLAVSIMGFDMIRRAVLKAAVFKVFAREASPREHFDPLGFWKHSIFTGVAAKVLAESSERFSACHPEDVYICGLLHDIGKIILLENALPQYEKVLAAAASSGRAESDVCKELLGFDHAEVAGVLAVQWFMPEDLAVAIRYHHDPLSDPFRNPLSSLINLADHLAWSAGHPSTSGLCVAPLDVRVCDEAGLDMQVVEDLLPRIGEDFSATGLPW